LRGIEIGRQGGVGLGWDSIQRRKKALTCGVGLSAAGGRRTYNFRVYAILG
jgi:hypothetical protein